MTRFVTGGAGFIGANYLFYLRGHYPDDRLVCIDKLTYAGDLSTLAPLLGQPNFRFAKVDICDREAVYGLFEEEHPDVVVNFAAESHVDRSIADPSLFLQTNIIGTSVLMDACRKYGNVRFHQVSTDEVYGDLPLDRPDLLFTEQTPLHTSSPYSSSKAAADLLAGAYGRTYGLPVTISRCSNNYGPYQFPEKLIPLMIVNALADRPLPVYGRGLNVRDWLYVGDHCRAIDLVVNHGRIGEVYNIGGHNEMRNIDIVRLICRKLGKPERLITYVADRQGHDLRYAIDPTKIHTELGWLPETRFADGIGRTIDWYLANRPWWEEILSGAYRTGCAAAAPRREHQDPKTTGPGARSGACGFLYAVSPLWFAAQPLFQAHERDAVDAVERARCDPGLAVAEVGVEPAGVGVFRVRVDAQLRAAVLPGVLFIKTHELRAVAVPGGRRVNDERVQHEHLLRRCVVRPRHLGIHRHLFTVDAPGGIDRAVALQHEQLAGVQRGLCGRARRVHAARPADADVPSLLGRVDRVIDLFNARKVVRSCGADDRHGYCLLSHVTKMSSGISAASARCPAGVWCTPSVV